MSDRFQLIARKQEIRQQIGRIRRQLEQAGDQLPPTNRRRIAKLETQLEKLMAEEYNLRLAIDRSS